LAYRCRSRQNFGGTKDFCSSFPKLARNVFVRLLQTLSHKDHEYLFLVWLPKKVFIFFANGGCHFLKTNKVGRHFLPGFQEFCPDFRGFYPDFHGFCPYYQGFVLIFDKSKHLGVRLRPRLLNHCASVFRFRLCRNNKMTNVKLRNSQGLHLLRRGTKILVHWYLKGKPCTLVSVGKIGSLRWQLRNGLVSIFLSRVSTNFDQCTFGTCHNTRRCLI